VIKKAIASQIVTAQDDIDFIHSLFPAKHPQFSLLMRGSDHGFSKE